MHTSVEKMVALLRDLEEPRPMVAIRETHDGRTISAAERRGFVMEYTDPSGTKTYMKTETGSAFLLLEEVR